MRSFWFSVCNAAKRGSDGDTAAAEDAVVAPGAADAAAAAAAAAAPAVSPRFKASFSVARRSARHLEAAASAARASIRSCHRHVIMEVGEERCENRIQEQGIAATIES
jgi:hypothetical protein